MPGWGAIPAGEYAFPGPLRDRLVGAILLAAKTSTTSLVVEWERDGERLPEPGDLEAVLDSTGRPVCVIRNTEVQVCRMADVTAAHARAEGEGFADATAWRAAHEEFWNSPEFVASLGDPPVALDDDTEVVCVAFEVVDHLPTPDGPAGA
ncbi:hypothetical protein MOPEL_071_00530 [Mobilicoccus pelagius NBRC 104925]|uniref:ASCH domain-containing protein n=1 Tax=Mobilicoccus pelagius NBRC 104925 TaxID=1089455 RepID=H5URH9_9MICO|nr:hypothetical protein MOPEL_071_00530 [Mobilicoccus pelagius NBRC 104925]